MSNTSTITPYDDDYQNSASSHARNVNHLDKAEKSNPGVLYSVVRWLVIGPQPTEVKLAEMRAIEQEYQAQIAELEASNPNLIRPPQLTTLNLQLNDLPSLLNTAANMGYSVADAVNQGSGKASVLLHHTNGTRIAITQNSLEKLSLHSAANVAPLQGLVSHHTQKQVLKHLADNGMQFDSARLPNGELQILAQEPNHGQRGGTARIKAQIKLDGTAWIDIDKCTGNRCENVVQQIASAMSGKVTSTRKKDTFFQLPGEPTKTQVKS